MNPHKTLSKPEREALIADLRSRIDTSPRDATMLLFAIHTGLRAHEMLSLVWSDQPLSDTDVGTVDPDTGIVVISRTLKHGQPRNVAVPAWLRGPLARLKETSPERPFPISYNRLGEIWRFYRNVRRPFHCLRHAFALMLHERTKDIHFVQRSLGHKNIANTLVYLDFDYSAQDFKKRMGIR
jgi:integrase